MSQKAPNFIDLAHRRQRQIALARWEGEGGATAHHGQAGLAAEDLPPQSLPLGQAELVQLQVRVIALENLVIALLADASDRQTELARDMADFISPRPGFTRHHLTVRAASEMISLVERATQFRPEPSG